MTIKIKFQVSHCHKKQSVRIRFRMRNLKFKAKDFTCTLLISSKGFTESFNSLGLISFNLKKIKQLILYNQQTHGAASRDF